MGNSSPKQTEIPIKMPEPSAPPADDVEPIVSQAAKGSAPVESKAVKPCFAVTLKGKPCRKAPTESGYCSSHENLAGKCGSLTLEGTRCKVVPAKGDAHCRFHKRGHNLCVAMTFDSTLCKLSRFSKSKYCQHHVSLSGSCAAITNAGTRCKLHPTEGRSYCKTHIQYAPAEEDFLPLTQRECSDPGTGKKIVYALELADSKFYIGRTEKDVKMRFEEHLSGRGSEWTKRFKPIKVIETQPFRDFEEDRLTLQYMKIHGMDNVRGGTYCQIELPQAVRDEIQRKIRGDTDGCYKCGSADHFVRDCKF